jgi:hypothetical protein
VHDGVVAFLIELQSPDRVLWTGTNFDNQTRIDVYVYPSDPDSAMTNSVPDRVVDIAAIGVPFGPSLLLLGLGLKRRPRRKLDNSLRRIIDQRAGASPPSSLR